MKSAADDAYKILCLLVICSEIVIFIVYIHITYCVENSSQKLSIKMYLVRILKKSESNNNLLTNADPKSLCSAIYLFVLDFRTL